jgi:glycosyltransferase involved in cell wall biosynthesis
MMTDLISIVIPSYNRWNYLKRAVQSVLSQSVLTQSYKSKNKNIKLEIVIVNDCSTQEEYYTKQLVNTVDINDNNNNNNIDIKLIHLPINTRQLFGFPCLSFVRNTGVKNSKGKYICFLDDDDWWTEDKIEKQYTQLVKSGLKFSCTDGYHVKDFKLEKHGLFNREDHWEILSQKCGLIDKFPNIWDSNLINKHNCVITSSVMMEKELYSTIGGMRFIPPPGEDYDCWKRCLQYTNCLYIDEGLFYYDACHGDGRQY